MTVARMVVRAAALLAAVGVVGQLSAVPLPSTRESQSLLRLSWRARGERLERCRPATATELASTPAHMRQATICEGVRVPPYELRVAVDAQELRSGLVAGSDVAGDRPMYVFHEFDLAPGRHHVRVELKRRDETAPADTSDARSAAVPRQLLLDTTIVAIAREVVLVTYNEEARRLDLVTPSNPEGSR
ncbi:MAG: hypothetical protein IT361_04620 [Gemmatimonadaceae bacterium]|nr:hypothetical protein [Gemmatimonadaceae bacterium]